MQGLVLAGCAEEPVTVRLVLHEGGAVDQRLRRVPDNVADRLLRVDPAARHPGQNTLLECTETCYYTAACVLCSKWFFYTKEKFRAHPS